MVEVVHVLGVLYTWKLTKQLYLEVYKCRQDELNYKVDYQYHTRKIVVKYLQLELTQMN